MSSSGHLVILQHFFGIKEPQLLLDITLHVATLFAVVLFLKNEVALLFKTVFLKDETGTGKTLLINIIISTIPTGIIGLLIEKKAAFIFASPRFVAFTLMITGFILLLPSLFKPIQQKKISYLQALIIGIAQGIAVLPGISRSGITIVTALLLGVEREMAGKYSFLASIPAIIGALILQLSQGNQEGISLGAFVLGFSSAFFSGLGALWVLFWFLKGKGGPNLHWFTPYCLLLGTSLLLWGN